MIGKHTQKSVCIIFIIIPHWKLTLWLFVLTLTLCIYYMWQATPACSKLLGDGQVLICLTTIANYGDCFTYEHRCCSCVQSRMKQKKLPRRHNWTNTVLCDKLIVQTCTVPMKLLPRWESTQWCGCESEVIIMRIAILLWLIVVTSATDASSQSSVSVDYNEEPEFDGIEISWSCSLLHCMSNFDRYYHQFPIFFSMVI